MNSYVNAFSKEILDQLVGPNHHLNNYETWLEHVASLIYLIGENRTSNTPIRPGWCLDLNKLDQFLEWDRHSNKTYTDGYIDAIKYYRACTGTGLKDAKDFVDNRKTELGI